MEWIPLLCCIIKPHPLQPSDHPPTRFQPSVYQKLCKLGFVVSSHRHLSEMVGSGFRRFKRNQDSGNQQVVSRFAFHQHKVSSALTTGLISASSCEIWTTGTYLSGSEALGASSSSLCPPHLTAGGEASSESEEKEALL